VIFDGNCHLSRKGRTLSEINGNFHRKSQILVLVVVVTVVVVMMVMTVMMVDSVGDDTVLNCALQQ